MNDYNPFITEGFVSLCGSRGMVLIKILRVTGSKYSFVLKSALPLSDKGDTML